MKFVLSLALAYLISALAFAQIPSGRQEPFVPMAVSYRAELVRNRERTSSDFDAVRTLGFNAIRLVVSWPDAEPERGQYRFDAIDTALELAGRSDLRVILRLEVSSPPAWLFEKYPDGRYVPAEATARVSQGRPCLDHPSVRADVAAFVAAATARAAGHGALRTIDVGSDLDSGFCLCPYTAQRFRDWTRSTFGGASRPVSQRSSDRAAFLAVARRDHLAVLAGAASARGNRVLTTTVSVPSLLRPPEARAGQDDWVMARVVDRYGMAVSQSARRGAESLLSTLPFAFEGLRGASGTNGWLLSLDEGTPAPDLRLWTWAAISRGARGVVYGEWRRSESNQGMALVGSDVRAAERAQTAAGLARAIGRNPALFAPLRPGKARVALVYDPRVDVGWIDLARVYEAFFERNVPVDVLHLDELATGAASGYALVASRPIAELPPTAGAALKAYVNTGGLLLTLSTRPPTVEKIAQGIKESRVTSGVKITGATGAVETRFLESADVLMLIGLNHTDTRQRVTMTFPPDTQEAIWQNMETGAAVNFIATANGPTYTYNFGAKDALVLMIRKSIR